MERVNAAKQIGIMGGTFDPIHFGHLRAAEAVLNSATCEQVWFVPTAQAPQKTEQPMAAAEHRMAMVQAAIDGQTGFKVCEMEIMRGGISYSVETAGELVRMYPDCQFHWIVGTDQLQNLVSWFMIEQLSELVSFIALARPGYPLDIRDLPVFLQKRVRLISMQPADVSSTTIRRRLQARQSLTKLVPDNVIRYIEEHGLYEN